MTWNPSPPQKRCKVTIKREQYKIKCVLFLLSSVSNLCKVSAKNRLTEEKSKASPNWKLTPTGKVNGGGGWRGLPFLTLSKTKFSEIAYQIH